MSNFNYADNWYTTRHKAIDMTNQRCCVSFRRVGDRKFLHVHHSQQSRSVLRRLLGFIFLGHTLSPSVSGYEIPGWDVFPVLADPHHLNHYGRSQDPRSLHYIKDWHKNGGWGTNLEKTKWKLRLKFLLCYFLV